MREVDDSKIREFRDRVKRTVIVDELSPLIPEKVINSAISQFGMVANVEIVKSPVNPLKGIGRAIVEMESEADAKNVVKHLQEFLFMVGGMPRPVSARHATEDMFEECPIKMNRPQLKPKIFKRGDKSPEAVLAFKLKTLHQKHMERVKLLQKMQREEEKNLHAEQEKQMNDYFKILDEFDKSDLDLANIKNIYRVR